MVMDAALEPLRYEHQPKELYESAELMLSLVPERSRVIDIGCGTGSLSQLLRERLACEVLGLEPNGDRCNAAASRGMNVINAELTDELARKVGKFDVVLFADVLEHLVDPWRALQLAKAVLAPNGAIVASVPNVAHWTVRANLLRGRFKYQPTGLMDATHLRWFTYDGLEDMFNSSGFRIESKLGSAGLWLPVYASRVPWCWLPKRVKTALVCRAVVWCHSLFACQHVVRAVRITPPSE